MNRIQKQSAPLLLSAICAVFFGLSCAAEQRASEVVLFSEVKWEALNPARGAQSPQAGTLWGDRGGEVPTGFLAKFVDGFSSPPHIHNVTYRAVVVSGLIHNDDPEAAKLWMPAGSFWTQPKGEVHITAAKGETNIALVEIDHGPYLVRPPDAAFDKGERPLNVHAANLVWVGVPGALPGPESPKLAYLWGQFKDKHSNGSFLKLPSNFQGEIHSQGSVFRAVVILGQPRFFAPEARTLEPGSYFSSRGEKSHKIAIDSGDEAVLYIRTNGIYRVVPEAAER